MSSQAYEISEKEEKIRKNWLRATLVYFIFYPMSLVILLAVVSGAIRTSPGLFWTSIVAVAITCLIPFWILRHCAYVKHGTAWLTWSLIVSPLQLCISFKDCGDAVESLVLVLNGFLFIWWYVYSIKLRKINKKIRLQKAQKKLHPEYLQSVETLKASSTIEDLDTLFHSLIEKWPQFEAVSSNEYKLRKSELLKKGQGVPAID